MVFDVQWWSQPMRPEGDNTGNGIKNQLGRPQLGEYAVLVREAVQNSWDARRKGKPVSMTIHIQRLGASVHAWRRWIGKSSLPDAQGKLLRTLNANSYVLIVSDRGTSGLGGPIRSDREDIKGENHNFVQFIRNVGEARDTKLGGGTYGFGKGIYYRISGPSAIIVDSKNTEPGNTSRRLMGAALTNAFTSDEGRRFTGRHWWGEVNDGVPDPILGGDAQRLSEALGLPGFEDGDTGTDIVVVLPDITLEDPKETIHTLAERLRGHVYWNLWPKFRTQQRPHGIHFRIEVDGEPIDMPAITTLPVLKDFARSLDNIAMRNGAVYKMNKYPAALGEFSVETVVRRVVQSSDPSVQSILEYAPIKPPYSDIARMRQAELVVDYVKGAAMPNPDVGYVGTFRASAYADLHFALAEPPTHDDWSTAGLTGSALGIVRGAKTFINDQCELHIRARSGTRSKMIQGLGKLSNELGSFVEGGTGTRATHPRKNKSGKSSTKPSNDNGFRSIGSSKVVLREGEPVVESTVEVREDRPEDLRLEAHANVILASGRRENPNNAPVGATDPEFIGWFFEEEKTPRGSEPVLVSAVLKPGTWKIRYRHMPDAALRVSIERV